MLRLRVASYGTVFERFAQGIADPCGDCRVGSGGELLDLSEKVIRKVDRRSYGSKHIG
jgi:hypothetical protein